MAAKLLHSLADENPDLQKQIGCMTGIFQLFDRQHVLTGGSRRIVGHAPKRLPSGYSYFHSLDGEANNTHGRSASMLKYSTPHKHHAQERQRISTESSRASFSTSSRSSSFSSIDCNPAPHTDPTPAYDRIIFPELDPTTSLPNHPSARFARHILDIRDVVKDSMHREIHGPSVKPRLANRERPWCLNEPREFLRSASYHATEGSSFSISRDAPRFSYDGREAGRAPLDVPKSARLSLDDSKSNHFLKSIRPVEFDDKVPIFQQPVGTHTRPPSVVAKLMGLESLPEPVSSSVDSNSVSGRSFADENGSNTPRLAVKTGQKPIKKEPGSPRWMNSDPSMEPISRYSIEPAHWKPVKAPSKSSTASSPSVYSEIEKRLKHLEFTQSGKDLRALKQILEAMQSKGFLGAEEGRNGQKSSSSTREARSVSNKHEKQHYDSPIVIMKPAKLVEKSGILPSSVIPLDSLLSRQMNTTESVDNSAGLSSRNKSCQRVDVRNERTLKNAHKSSRVSRVAKDGNVGPESISPRMQQKKIVLERRSRPSTPDSIKSRRQPSKQQGDSDSPRRRHWTKLVGLHQSGDQLSEPEVDWRRIDENLVQSNESLPVNASKFVLSDLVDKVKKSTSGAESADFGFVPPEHSSPVSVLDKVICKDDSPSPSPVKYVGKTIIVDASTEKNSDPTALGKENHPDSSPPAQSQIDRNKLQNIETLVQKLRRLNSTHDEARTDYIASLCEQATNPDHRYISEILLASGLLLRELGSSLANFQFHPSGHPINPELFLVLEQTKTGVLSGDRLHRKLIFDTINDILAQRLVGPGSKRWSGEASRLGLSAQRLLGDLCSEIERLRVRGAACEEDEGWKEFMRDDLMPEFGGWKDFKVEASGAVLDIERSIFKDLVNEIVIGESSGSRAKPGGRRRVLK